MVKPQAPCKRPEGMCTLRTTTCKFDGTCPHGYEQYQKDVIKYRDLVHGAKFADDVEASIFVRRKLIADRIKGKI